MTRTYLPSMLAALVLCGVAPAAEIIRISEADYPTILPKGKEVDAIIGDYLLHNDRIVLVVADTVPDRKANMTTPRVGGGVIDLTTMHNQSDQLTAYYPAGMQFAFTKATVHTAKGQEVKLTCESEPNSNGLKAAVTYTLRDGEPFVAVTQVFSNTGSKDVRTALSDVVRADTTFTKVPKGQTNLFWVNDDWFEQAYGLTVENLVLDSQSDNRRSSIFYLKDGERTVSIAPGESFTIEAKLIPAPSMLALKGIVAELTGEACCPVTVTVKQADETPVAHASIVVKKGEETVGSARTTADGEAKFSLPKGSYTVEASALARGERSQTLEVADESAVTLQLENPPVLKAHITENGGPVPCKLQFQGIEDTKDPWLGPNTQGPALENLYYSHNGSFEQVLPAGKYRVLISRGIEYDLVTQTIEMKPGEVTELTASMVRSVQSPGWVSSDPHNHSTPSGDNVTTMHSRVLNILAEHMEFVPCTEHNRIDSYEPILEKLGCKHLLATCTGMELTGGPLPLNHQNAFPLIMKPGLQDNGAPQTDEDPELQIRRLATWDNNSEKYVHTNHPDLGWMYFDRDGNGERDAGFYRMFAFQDAIEVWGNSQVSTREERILAMEPITERGRNDRLFNWLQLLNQGYRVVGVTASDSHYANHGTGWIRNFVKCSTEDLTKIDTMEMVREYQQGHVVLSTGPFLETSLKVGEQSLLPGDSVVLDGNEAVFSVRVQCPNWFDINRVQVLVNGRALPEYNFTRKTHAALFSDQVVRFEHTFPVTLKEDSHLIVVATGEGLGFGDVFGPGMQDAPPTAIANPIYVDIDGNGFVANGDTLGHPLPVKAGTRKQALRLFKSRLESAIGD